MPQVMVTKTLSVPTQALWDLVRDFGNVSWIPGGSDGVKIEGEGPGMFRILQNPAGGEVHERLDKIDDANRSVTYSIPKGIPFPVSLYVATMTVRDDGGNGQLEWKCEFEPDGATEQEAGGGIEQMYGVMIGWIEETLSK